MNRSLLAGGLVVVLVVVGMASLRGEVIALAIPLLLYLLAGFLWEPQGLALTASREISAERVSPGEPVVITVTVTNKGAAQHNLLLEDFLPPEIDVVQGASRHLVTLKNGETFTWRYTITAKRGHYPFKGIHAEATDLLGMTSKSMFIPSSGKLFILPARTPQIRRIAIRPRGTRVYAGTIPARTGGPGVEFFGVRDYQPGDPQQWINWRTSARHASQLFSNEFEQERVADVGIILDARRRVNEFGAGQSLFEHSVMAAASFSEAFLSSGNRVGLFVYGKYVNWTYPGYGKMQREKILHALALAEPGDSEVFSTLLIPRRLFPAYSQMVLISPLAEGDLDNLIQFRSAGYQLIVISPDPAAFELANLPQNRSTQLAARIVQLERELMLHRLQRAGIQVVNWNVTRPLENIVRAALSRPPGWLQAIRAGGGA